MSSCRKTVTVILLLMVMIAPQAYTLRFQATIESRIEKADLIVVGTLELVHSKYWSVSRSYTEGTAFDTNYYDLGELNVREVLKGKAPHKLYFVYRNIAMGDIRKGDELVLSPGKDAIWLLHKCDKFMEQVFEFPFYTAHMLEDVVDMEGLSYLKKNCAHLLDRVE